MQSTIFKEQDKSGVAASPELPEPLEAARSTLYRKSLMLLEVGITLAWSKP